MQMEYVDEKELDVICLKNLIEIQDEIKDYCQNNPSYDYPYRSNVRGFLCYYKNKLDKKRQERRKEIFRQRAIRENNEIEIRRNFIGTHESTKENLEQDKKEHFLRYEKEKEIMKREDEK